MIHRLHTDDEGFVTHATTYDGPAPDDLSGHDATDREVVLHSDARGVLYRCPDGTVCLDQDDFTLWRRLRGRGVDGAVVMDRIRAVRGARALCTDDIPALVAPRAASPVPGPFPLPNLPFAFPEVPGLEVRQAGTDDLDPVAQEMVARGEMPAECPEGYGCGCTPRSRHAWMRLAEEWDDPRYGQFLTTWQGRPIQWERLWLPEDSTVPISTRTWHLTRERPHWFWREVWRPVADGLAQLGYSEVRGWVRGDLGYWARSLEQHYRGQVLSTGPHRIEVAYRLAAIPFQGWPARRTGGVGWEHRVGSVVVQEATDADLPVVDTWLAGNLPPARAPYVRQMLQEWWHLDRAACLLVWEDGQLAGVRVVRERQATRSNIGFLGPVPQEGAGSAVIATDGVRRWHQAAGYTTATAFIPAWQATNPRMVAQLARGGFRQVARRRYPKGDFIEVEATV